MEGGQRLGKKMSHFFAGRLMYRSNRTPETENFTEIFSAMHFGSDAAVHVMGGGGLGQAFNVIGLHYLKFPITALLFIWVLSLIIKYSKSSKNMKL